MQTITVGDYDLGGYRVSRNQAGIITGISRIINIDSGDIDPRKKKIVVNSFGSITGTETLPDPNEEQTTNSAISFSKELSIETSREGKLYIKCTCDIPVSNIEDGLYNKDTIDNITSFSCSSPEKELEYFRIRNNRIEEYYAITKYILPIATYTISISLLGNRPYILEAKLV